MQADQVDDLQGLGPAGLLVDPLDLQGKGHVVEDRSVGEEGEVLEDHAHLVAAELDQFMIRGGAEVLAVEVDLAGRRLDETRHAAHQGGLA